MSLNSLHKAPAVPGDLPKHVSAHKQAVFTLGEVYVVIFFA